MRTPITYTYTYVQKLICNPKSGDPNLLHKLAENIENGKKERTDPLVCSYVIDY